MNPRMKLPGAYRFIQKRYMPTPRKYLRPRIDGYEELSSRERHVRRAIYLKNLIIQRPGRVMSMQDLRDECDKVGVRARKFYYLLEFYKTIFHTRVDRRRMEWIELGPDGLKLLELEHKLLKEHEPVMVENLRKLLMMSSSESIPLRKIAACREFFGLPFDFEQNLVHKFPQFFEVVMRRDKQLSETAPFLKLTSWDPVLAVPRREADADESNRPPFSFRLRLPKKGLCRKDQLFLEQFQELSFPSPYDPGHAFPSHSREAVKRAVAVAHEFLSLTQEKRVFLDCLQSIRRETGLPRKVDQLLYRYDCIFYVSSGCSFPRFPPRKLVFLQEGFNKPKDYEIAKLLYKGHMVQLKEGFEQIMIFLDKAYDREHGTDSFTDGRPFPTIPFDAFQSTFQADRFSEEMNKFSQAEDFYAPLVT